MKADDGWMKMNKQLAVVFKSNISEAYKLGKAINETGIDMKKMGRTISDIGKTGINIAPLKKQLKELRDSMAAGRHALNYSKTLSF